MMGYVFTVGAIDIQVKGVDLRIGKEIQDEVCSDCK